MEVVNSYANIDRRERRPRLNRNTSQLDFWWSSTGLLLRNLLESAGYSQKDQEFHLYFFLSLVAPRLGPAPKPKWKSPQWSSFMTDDGTPVELSWDWGWGDSQPVIRYSVEPISRIAGTPADPDNAYAGMRMMSELEKTIPGLNLEWYSHFRERLADVMIDDSSAAEQHRSKFFTAFDLNGSDVLVKAYFMPAFKAEQESTTKEQVTTEAVTSLPSYNKSDYRAYHSLLDFIHATHETLGLEIEIVAIDCERPEDSRLKIYIRSRATSFDSVIRVLSMDQKLAKHTTPEVVSQLQGIWTSLFPQGRILSKDLPETDHRTGGMLYAFEIRSGYDLAMPKVYLPVRHYSPNDLSVTRAVSEYNIRQGNIRQAGKFPSLMANTFSLERLRTGKGVQTYVGCSVRNGAVKVISYLNPQVFRRMNFDVSE